MGNSEANGAWAPGLAGKVVIVTGAGRLRSIGRSIALEMACQGAKVVITGTGRDPSTFPADEKEVGWRDIDSVAAQIRELGGEALPIVSDIADPAAVQALVERVVSEFGGIDVLVNNAGAARAGDRCAIVDMTYEDWKRVLTVNLDGTFLLSQAAARAMIAAGGGGVILNLSSIASRLAAPNTSVYSASKIAINALSRVMALELAPHGIRVNAVLPGIIETSRMDDVERGAAWDNFVKTYTPLGVAGEGPEVASLCTYLASDLAKWITGQEIAVDGGASWH